MEINEIKNVLLNTKLLDEVYVSGDSNHLQIITISNRFSNMNSVNRQKIVYAPLMEYIFDKQIHSLSIKTYTNDEWQEKNKLYDIKI